MERNKWIKATRSGNNGQCVEVRDQGTEVSVRDTKDRSGPMLTFTPQTWRAFTDGAKRGEFDR